MVKYPPPPLPEISERVYRRVRDRIYPRAPSLHTTPPASAEAAENYYARANDATGLYEAIAAKLTEQRKFVLWWDGQEKQKATPGNLGPSQTTDGPTASRSN